jgi:hypothetical protein
MARRGRKRQLDVEAQYWALLANGIGTVEACQTLGIGRKTGYRWRAETGGLAPERLPEGGCSSRFLSRLDRQRIADGYTAVAGSNYRTGPSAAAQAARGAVPAHVRACLRWVGVLT